MCDLVLAVWYGSSPSFRTCFGDDWARHVHNGTGTPYYVNQKTGVSQWGKPPGNEDSVADALGSEQISANAMTTNPMANKRNSRHPKI